MATLRVRQPLLNAPATAGAPFVGITDLPPRGRPFPTALRTWLVATPLLLIGQDAIPPNRFQYDYPVPKTRPFPVQNRTYLQPTPLQLIGQDAIPPQRFQYDYPVPKQRPFPVQNRTLISDGLSRITPSVPATWTDLPPRGPTFPTANRTYLQSVNLFLLGKDAIPPQRFVYDYPNPGRKRPPDLTIATSGLSLSTSVAAAAPFYQTEWPLPKRQVVFDETWVRPSLGLTAVAAPFYQTEWPLPKRQVVFDETWVRSSLSVSSVAPFGQLDWPVPTRRRQRDASIVSASLDIASVAPFSQTDWPIPPRNPARAATTWVSPPLLLEIVPSAYVMAAETGAFSLNGQDATLTYTPVVEDTDGHRAGWPPAYTKEQLEQFLEKRRPKPAQEETPAAVQVVQVSPLVEPVVQPKIGPLGPLGAVGQAVAGDPEPVDDSAVIELIAALDKAVEDENDDEEMAIQVILGLI